MPTQLIRSPYRIPQKARGSVMTIGNFDGVHLGHQKLLSAVVQRAKARQAPSLVLTFEPHAFEFFGKALPRITRLREKFIALSQTGIDYVLILPFNQKLADLSASDFITHILVEELHPVQLILGEDFHFGRGREGDITLLKQMGKSAGFSVEILPTVLEHGEKISSTRVRRALQAGDQTLVERLLGHPYRMSGRVSHGDKRGREWGFPTANIFLHRKLTPVRGVYTVYVHGIAPKPLPGVANIGIRPTVDGTRTLLEVHLLDFDQLIYGCYVQVEFCQKLRDEVRYPTIELLKAQIAQDVIDARNDVKKHGVS
jgi:riboflavin kinase / FMN adenylyltransferase